MQYLLFIPAWLLFYILYLFAGQSLEAEKEKYQRHCDLLLYRKAQLTKELAACRQYKDYCESPVWLEYQIMRVLGYTPEGYRKVVLERDNSDP